MKKKEQNRYCATNPIKRFLYVTYRVSTVVIPLISREYVYVIQTNETYDCVDTSALYIRILPWDCVWDINQP